MWILPKQLHTSAFVPDTAALISDLSELSDACAQSLLVRSKPMPARTWSRKWKRDCWTRHLSGRILKPFHTADFAESWTYSVAAIHASHSAPPASDLARTIHGTYGPGSETASTTCAPDSVSLRTSRDMSHWGFGTCSATWKNWVTKQRGEYSARLKSARRTSGNGSLSWPTATTRDHKDGTADSCRNVPVNCLLGRAVHQNYNTIGSPPELWPTASVCGNYNRKGCSSTSGDGLITAVNLWPTPNVPNGGRRPSREAMESGRKIQIGTENAVGGKLNPRWVECLMGVPVGWTNCGSLETESFRQQQRKHSEHYTNA